MCAGNMYLHVVTVSLSLEWMALLVLGTQPTLGVALRVLIVFTLLEFIHSSLFFSDFDPGQSCTNCNILERS